MTRRERIACIDWEIDAFLCASYRRLLLDPTAPIGKGARTDIKRNYLSAIMRMRQCGFVRVLP